MLATRQQKEEENFKNPSSRVVDFGVTDTHFHTLVPDGFSHITDAFLVLTQINWDVFKGTVSKNLNILIKSSHCNPAGWMVEETLGL